VCLYVCDQETPKMEAWTPWTISACGKIKIIKNKNIRNIDSYTSIFREDKAETACRKCKYKSTKHLRTLKTWLTTFSYNSCLKKWTCKVPMNIIEEARNVIFLKYFSKYFVPASLLALAISNVSWKVHCLKIRCLQGFRNKLKTVSEENLLPYTSSLD
jgi:hypothetical protein